MDNVYIDIESPEYKAKQLADNAQDYKDCMIVFRQHLIKERENTELYKKANEIKETRIKRFESASLFRRLAFAITGKL